MPKINAPNFTFFDYLEIETYYKILVKSYLNLMNFKLRADNRC